MSELMTKREIFNQIARTCAEVCDVSVDDILNGCRKEDVVTARALCIFWANAAGFSVESLIQACGKNNANSINSIKSNIEDMWVERFAFHMLAVEIGRRLLDHARSIGEDFDMWKPIRHMSKVTGKY